LETAVGREIEWLIMTELLKLPYKQEGRVSSKDALSETILSSRQGQAAVQNIADSNGSRVDDSVFRERLEEALATYIDTRAAATEITTTLVALGAGALTLKQATPGTIVGHTCNLPSARHRHGSASSDRLVSAWGHAWGLWYGAFPVATSPALSAALTEGLISVGAIAAAVSGIMADPVQRRQLSGFELPAGAFRVARS